jgi:hypothetical protein
MPEQAVVIPARSATLVVGDRQIPVDEWPMARSADERRSVEIGATEDGQLVIAPGRHVVVRLVGTSLLAIAAGLLPSLAGVAMQVPPRAIAVMSAILAAIAVLVLRGQLARLRRFRFDRQTGRLVIERRAGFRPEWRPERDEPLASVLAVQLLFGGHHSVSETQGAGEQQTTTYREFSGYELNLILDGPESTRLHLLALADWDWLRRAGNEVGAYLGVPVLDRLYHGD